MGTNVLLVVHGGVCFFKINESKLVCLDCLFYWQFTSSFLLLQTLKQHPWRLRFKEPQKYNKQSNGFFFLGCICKENVDTCALDGKCLSSFLRITSCVWLQEDGNTGLLYWPGSLHLQPLLMLKHHPLCLSLLSVYFNKYCLYHILILEIYIGEWFV